VIFQVRTLGGLDVVGPDGRDVRAILAQPKRLALLVYLAATRRFRRRDIVVGLFWPDLDQEHARGALRQALRFLRRASDEGLVASRGEDEIGVNQSLVVCDALAFEEAVEEGRSAEALSLYRGDFLEGFFVSDAAPELDRWIEQERFRLRHLAATAAWSVAEDKRNAGDGRGASASARAAVAVLGDDEGELRRLIAFLDDLGDRAAALAAYEELVRRLKHEYEAEPAPETQALMRSVRDRTRPNLPAPDAAAPQSAPPMAPAPPARRRGRYGALVGLAAISIFALTGYLVAFGPHTPAPRLTLAVLPMEDLSGDTTQGYMVEGLTDQLITDLAMTPGLDVINRRTMMEFRGSTSALRDIARALNAGAVLVSAMQRMSDTVHLTAQLIMAGDERVLWGQAYRGTWSDLMRIQNEIARVVSQRLRTPASPEGRRSLAGMRPYDPESFDLYVKARYWWNKRGPGLLRSIALFDEALQRDPTFALAYSGMADAYVQLGYGSLLGPADAFPKAREAARRALALDSTLAEPHATLGYVAMYYDWDWRSAEAEFQRALALNPSYATAHEWYGLFLTAMGRFDEAMAHEQRAQELDPLSAAIAGTAGWVLYYSGRLTQAEHQLKIALRMDPGFALGHLYLSRIYLAQGRLDSALGQSAATGPVRTTVPTLAGEGYILARNGRPDLARRVLAQLDSMVRTQYVTAYAVALVHAALGQRDSAFAWLDQAVDERTHWLVWLNRDSRWDLIRDQPRFQAIVRRVGLPP
jgi:TolB-like protein/DNA-binding SARP family transcriptional activator/Tfp pilus assembly protein PilF